MALKLLLAVSSSAACPPPCHHRRPSSSSTLPRHLCGSYGRREVFLKTAALSVISVALTLGFSPPPAALADSSETPAPPPAPDAVDSPPPPPPPPRKPVLPGIASTKTWFQYVGDGFSIRVPPTFEDIMEPEDYNAGLSLYGDKAKPMTFAARFASPDRNTKYEFHHHRYQEVGAQSLHFSIATGSEVLSVVIRPSNQLKITFLEAQDITDFGTLKEAAKIFVPGGATLYSARTIRIKEDESLRSYYFYEFGIDDQHLALVAAVNSGKAIIAGASAPQSKWEEDGVKLRSAAISLSVA